MADAIQGEQPQSEPVEQPVQPAEQKAVARETQSLAEVIRQSREAREARAKIQGEVTVLKSELDQARAELAKARQAEDPLTDPAGWARARKLAPKDQQLFGEALLYDLVPDKAPAELRVKLLEAKLAREAKARDEATQAERAKAEQEAVVRSLRDYETTLLVSAKSFKAGVFPESEAWFDGDADSHAKSLLATARNLAEVAKTKGEVANLDPAHVADVLEKEIARKMASRDARRAAASKSAAVPGETPEVGGKQPAVLSTKGLGTGGPRPPARDDRERIQRAVAAAFGQKQ